MTNGSVQIGVLDASIKSRGHAAPIADEADGLTAMASTNAVLCGARNGYTILLDPWEAA